VIGTIETGFYATFISRGVRGNLRIDFLQINNMQWLMGNPEREFVGVIMDNLICGELFERQLTRVQLTNALLDASELGRGPADVLTNFSHTFTGDVLVSLQLNDEELELPIVLDLRDVFDFLSEYFASWTGYLAATRIMPRL